MNKRHLIVLTAALLGAGLLALTTGAAAAPAQYRIDRYTVASGGGMAASEDFVVQGTCGQAVVGAASGEGVEMGAGFWGGAEPSAPAVERVYLPLVMREVVAARP